MPPPPPKPMPYKAKSTAPPPPPVKPMPQLEDPNSRPSGGGAPAPPKPQPYQQKQQQQQHRPPPPVYHQHDDDEDDDQVDNSRRNSSNNNINSIADLPANYRRPAANGSLTPKNGTSAGGSRGGASAGGASPGDSGTNYPTVSTPSTGGGGGRRGSSSGAPVPAAGATTGGSGRRGSAQQDSTYMYQQQQQTRLSVPQGMDAEAIARMTLQGSGKGEIPYGERADITESELEKMRTQIAELTRENQMNAKRLAEFYSPQSSVAAGGQQQQSSSNGGVTICNENTPVNLLLARINRLETALQLESITREELETKNQAHVVEVALLSRRLEIAKQKLQRARRESQ